MIVTHNQIHGNSYQFSFIKNVIDFAKKHHLEIIFLRWKSLKSKAEELMI